MFTFDIESAGLVKAWVGVRAAVRGGMRKGVSMGVAEGAQEARTAHRFQNRTGNLEKSIVGVVTASRTSVGAANGSNRIGRLKVDNLDGAIDGAHFGEMRATMEYASFVENGTKPHVILPKRGKWLAWENPQGDWHFARKVNHPGTKPYGYMAQAYLKCERVMIREVHSGIAVAQSILDQ